jgi:hypothetical protein
MTAVQAINKIRNRILMPNVLPQYTASTETFRPRIKNERTIELCFEGHYFHDIRRWMQPYTDPNWGVDIEQVKATAPFPPAYPTGFKYTRVLLPPERQTIWKDAMYYFPFPTDDMFKMKNFTPNAIW